MLNNLAHTQTYESCAFLPSVYGYNGLQITKFKFSDPMHVNGYTYFAGGQQNDGSIKSARISVVTFTGTITCVLHYLPSQSERDALCDAVANAKDSGVAIRLARVPQATAGWFCGIVPADQVPEDRRFIEGESTQSTQGRPWHRK